MMDGQWLKAAMEDDGTLAAEVLVKLLQAPVAPTPPPPAAVVPMKWTVRQPRTKSGSNKRARARGSPTTPLSWTGGSTSLSGGAAPAAAGDGSEQSSRRGAGSKPRKAFIIARGTLGGTPTICQKTKTPLDTQGLEGDNGLWSKKELKRSIIYQKYVFLEYQIYNSFVAQTIASIRAKLGKKKSENVLLKKLKANLAAVPSAKPIAGPRAARPVPVYVPVNVPLPMNVPLPVNVVVPVPVPVPEPVTVSLFSSLTEVKGGSDKFVIPDLNLTFVESKDAGASDV
ncbi:hypothetical protein DCAR_0518635 [Daucus carota subsp. sativus]|uniref:Uncharacterized protein n=1 Tax=Daucus carota subsp. sativus TaxID=79200 RepID=A0AAF1AZW7_DAUCS|nr:hypothetical protein DCAR_0518635 [Daucus carota subsp. sativus]